MLGRGRNKAIAGQVLCEVDFMVQEGGLGRCGRHDGYLERT